MDTSIVIATCSRAASLQVALESLVREAVALERPVEIVVVDDGSTDGTPAVLREFQRSSAIPIRVLQGDREGVAAARNLGSFAARGAWLASFDDDQIALPGWLRALREMADESGAACVGGSVQLQLPPGELLDQFGPRVRKLLGEHHPGDVPHKYQRGHLPATNNVLIRRDVFEKLGGYDARFTEGAEDTDFFDRLRAAGFAMRYQPASAALHVLPQRRLERANIRWTSMRVGASAARLYCRNGQVWPPVKWAALRAGVAIVRDLPQLLWAKLRGNRSAALDAWCSLWYTTGLLRALPAMMRQKDSAFLRSLNFRQRNGERS